MEQEKNSNENWEITRERYVAFIDIMGFKDMLFRKNSAEIYNMMKGIHDVVQLDNAGILPMQAMQSPEKMSALVFTNGEIKGGSFRTNLNTDSDEILIKSNRVRSAMYSDSIMLYTKDNSPQSRQLLEMSLSAILDYMYAESIPFKGAMAKGEMTIDVESSIYFGQPLTDAYLLQEELHFYGIVLHGSAQFGPALVTLTRNVFPIECHFKNGKSEHHCIIPGILIFIQQEAAQKIANGLEKMRISTSGHLRRYIDNTEDFLNKSSKYFAEKMDELNNGAAQQAGEKTDPTS
jgi:hypothetical protein